MANIQIVASKRRHAETDRVSRLHSLGYHHKINLREGIEMVFEEFAGRYDEIVAGVAH